MSREVGIWKKARGLSLSPPSWHLHLLWNACRVNCSFFYNLYVLQGSKEQLALSIATDGFTRLHSYTCLLLFGLKKEFLLMPWQEYKVYCNGLVTDN